MKIKFILGASILLLVSVSSAQSSVIWNMGFNDSGQFRLLGAQNFDVGGILYNVEFTKTPDYFFTPSPPYVQRPIFDFHTKEEATLASQALLDQVFLDVGIPFDSDPQLTNGCTGTTAGTQPGDPYPCLIVTPYENAIPLESPWFFHGMATDNVIEPNNQQAEDQVRVFNYDDPCGGCLDAGITATVWTPVSPVPIPAAAWLFGTALIGLVGFSRRRKAA